MDSTLLKYFLRIYELRNLSRAADSLNISQPALSKGLRRLEDTLRLSLFERSRSGMRPTAVANLLAKHAQNVDNEMRAISLAISNLRNASSGSVVFGLTPATAEGLLIPVTTYLQRKRSQLGLSVVEAMPEQLLDYLLKGAIEFAVCTATPIPGDTELTMTPLLRDSVVIVAGRGHPLVRSKRPAMRNLLKFPWILGPYSGVIRHWFESRFVNSGIMPPVPRIETSSMSLMRHILQGDLFLTFIPFIAVANSIRSGDLRVIMPDDFQLIRTITLSHRRRETLSAGARIIIDALVLSHQSITKTAKFTTARGHLK